MTDPFAFTLTIVVATTGLVVLGLVALRRYGWRRLVPVLVAVELGVLVLAVLDGIGVLTGPGPAEPATHLAYLAVVVLILPLAAGQAARERGGPWGGVLVALALLVLAVLIVRLVATGRPASDVSSGFHRPSLASTRALVTGAGADAMAGHDGTAGMAWGWLRLSAKGWPEDGFETLTYAMEFDTAEDAWADLRRFLDRAAPTSPSAAAGAALVRSVRVVPDAPVVLPCPPHAWIVYRAPRGTTVERHITTFLAQQRVALTRLLLPDAVIGHAA